MSFVQYLNYYPTYDLLDMALSMSNKSDLRLFIDLKGCFQSLYQKWAIEQILNESKISQKVDPSPLYSVLYFLSFHNLYAKKRNIKIKYYFFLESGDSDYHKNIYKHYKKSRKSRTTLFDFDETDTSLYFKILRKNYEIMQKIINRIPNCYFIYLKNMEADFISYFLINKILKDELLNCCNLIYSSDKDMIQCLESENAYQYVKTVKTRKILHKSNALNYFFKEELYTPDIYFYLFPVIMAIVGDNSDDIPNLKKGIGFKTIIKNLKELKEYIPDINELYEKILSNQKSVLERPRTNNKLLNIIYENQENFIRNLKLISFELLSYYFVNECSINVYEKLKNFKETLYNLEDKKLSSWKSLYLVLNNLVPLDLNIEKSVIQNLFLKELL